MSQASTRHIDTLPDESNALKHDKRGLLSLKIDGSSAVGSQFCITLDECHYFDGVHCVIGQVVDGEEVLR